MAEASVADTVAASGRMHSLNCRLCCVTPASGIA